MSRKRFFWLDLEMTGLDVRADRILECALIVTDKLLEPKYTFETAVYQPPEVLAGMNDWCKQQHGESGLTERVPHGITEQRLDEQLCEIAAKHAKKNPVILCGNSIHCDRKFIDAYLPGFAATLHHRMLDVSSFKIVFREMLGKEFAKENKHLALDDIKESIAELKYYMGAINAEGLADIAS